MTVRAKTEHTHITQTAEGTEPSSVTLSVLNTSHPFYIRALTCLLKPTALVSFPYFKEIEYNTTFRWLIETNKNWGVPQQLSCNSQQYCLFMCLVNFLVALKPSLRSPRARLQRHHLTPFTFLFWSQNEWRTFSRTSSWPISQNCTSAETMVDTIVVVIVVVVIVVAVVVGAVIVVVASSVVIVVVVAAKMQFLTNT